MYHPQLTTFISVAESGSFMKTADALFITPTGHNEADQCA